LAIGVSDHHAVALAEAPERTCADRSLELEDRRCAGEKRGVLLRLSISAQ
jgi:hypothetical protein